MQKNWKNFVNLSLISVLVCLNFNCLEDESKNKKTLSDNRLASDNQIASGNRVASGNKAISPEITDSEISAHGTVDAQLLEELKLQLLQEIRGDGNQINDPIVSWILATGLSSIPLTLFLYLLLHRFKSFRILKDKIRGNCSHNKLPSSNGSSCR